jgi:hypothetical protein
MFIQKIYSKKIRKILPASSTKKYVQKIFCFTGNICLYEIACVYRKQAFSFFLLSVGLCLEGKFLVTNYEFGGSFGMRLS